MATEYRPGEKCEASGIYQVTHDSNHVQLHEVTVVFGEPFPPCKGCGHHPRYVPTHLAHHVRNHAHFK